ncbi:MAG: glycosyltransferase, partial [Thiohalospira sp.]
GPLAPVGDDAALATSLAELLDQPPSAATMAKAVEPFRAESSAAAYLRAMGVETASSATGTPQ